LAFKIIKVGWQTPSKATNFRQQYKKISLNISENLPIISIAGLNNSPGCITGLFLPKYFVAAISPG
jgi:hypothetical protein